MHKAQIIFWYKVLFKKKKILKLILGITDFVFTRETTKKKDWSTYGSAAHWLEPQHVRSSEDQSKEGRYTKSEQFLGWLGFALTTPKTDQIN